MKFPDERPYAFPEKAARKLVEIANSVEAVQEGRIFIELINGPFLYEHKGNPAEYKAGLDLAIAKGWLTLDRSGTFEAICADCIDRAMTHPPAYTRMKATNAPASIRDFGRLLKCRKTSFIREKFTKERRAARSFAQEYFERYPKDRYQTEVAIPAMATDITPRRRPQK
jgi:hypothetical protein